MHEDSPDRPFLWSEIHSIAKERTAQLDATIRAEIGKPETAVPKSGADRRQFFLLLEEKANAWGDRARDAYEDCLTEIGRADSHSARWSVFHDGLSFFLHDNLHDLLCLECGYFVQRFHKVRRPNQPRTYTTNEVPIDVRHLFNGICDRVKSRIEKEFTRNQDEGWLAITQKLLRETQLPNPIAPALYGPQPVASADEARKFPPRPEAEPTSTPANQPSASRCPLNKYRSEMKRAILIQLTKNPSANDLEVCRGLDADGAAEMPARWGNGAVGEREFVSVYRDPARRRRVEIAISKVRADLRKNGLMD